MITKKKMYRITNRTIAAPFTSSLAHELTKAFLAMDDLTKGNITNTLEDTLELANYLLNKETKAVNIPAVIIEDTDAMHAILVSACDIADAINERGNGYIDVLEDLGLTDNLNPDEIPYSVDLGISYLLNAIYMNDVQYRSFLNKRDCPNVKVGDIVEANEVSEYFCYDYGNPFYITVRNIRCAADRVIEWIKSSDSLIYGYNTLSCQVTSQTVVAKTATFKEV